MDQASCDTVNKRDTDISDIESDEFLDTNEEEFANEEAWLLTEDNFGIESHNLAFKTYCSDAEASLDINDLLYELKLVHKPSSVETNKGLYSVDSNRIIDSRTFTRPKKYPNHPPLSSIIANSGGDDGRRGKFQRRLTTTITPTPGIFSKVEDLSRTNNRPVHNWEDGSAEGLADIENSAKKRNRDALPASILDRLQELKKSNSSYISARTQERNRQLNFINGNCEDSENLENSNAAELSIVNATNVSDIYNNIPDYSGTFLQENLLSLEDLSFNNPSNYSSLVREMEDNEMYYCPTGDIASKDSIINRRLTFGGLELPSVHGRLSEESAAGMQTSRLLELSGDARRSSITKKINTTYDLENSDEISEKDATFTKYGTARKSASLDASDALRTANPDAARKINTTYELKNDDEIINKSEDNNTFVKCEQKRKSGVILKSDLIKDMNKTNSYKNCDNQDVDIGDLNVNNVGHNFNETYAQNELNNVNSEKYTTKIFDATFKKGSLIDKQNGKKESDHSEDDCMSTTSDNSLRSVDSSSELKNIEELKSIAIQQSKKLSYVKFSTPNRPSMKRNSDDWRNFSPIEKGAGDGESQGSSNTSSRGTSPRRRSASPLYEAPPKVRSMPMKPPPKVPQRELKLKPNLARPSQASKTFVSNGRTPSEPASARKIDCKTSASVAGMPVMKQSITPLAAVPSESSTKTSVRIPSGIPRPSSRLKQPQIRAINVYKK